MEEAGDDAAVLAPGAVVAAGNSLGPAFKGCHGNSMGIAYFNLSKSIGAISRWRYEGSTTRVLDMIGSCITVSTRN